MIEVRQFGRMDKQDIYLFNLENDYLKIGILNFGGIIKYFNVKTNEGEKNIVFGVEDVREYLREGNYSSAIIGRVANRIKNGTFEANGERCYITKNDGEHTNHGGLEGFDRKIFDYQVNGDVLTLFLFSRDGDQGFPGNLKLDVEYTLNYNEFCIRFIAKSDKDTVFAPTCHPYFNLANHDEPIYDTRLKINAQAFAALDFQCFPTGELREVAGTAFDFTQFKPIENGIFPGDSQTKLVNGFDHCFTVQGTHIASAYSPKNKTVKSRL